ncbi:MAG: PAS domain S-box protein [Bacteroidota bacterium]|nr:PAS domain S-box protein [Bacteroidota bacterium]
MKEIKFQNKMIICFILALFLIPLKNIYAQSENIDALKKQLHKYELQNSKDTNYANILFELGKSTSVTKPLESIKYLQKAKDLFLANDSKRNLSNTYSILARLYSNQGSYYFAMEFYLLNYKVLTELNDKNAIGYNFGEIANAYYHQKLFEISKKYYLKAAALFNETKEYYGLSVMNNNLGLIEMEFNNFNEALRYYKIALELRKKSNNPFYIAHSLQYIGSVYTKLNKLALAEKYLDSSMTILLSIKNRRIEDNKYLGKVYDDFGDLYLKKNIYSQALDNYYLALKQFTDINDFMNIINVYNKISGIYIKQNKKVLAEESIKKTIKLVEQSNLLNEKRNSYNLYIQYFALINKPDSIIKYIGITDSLAKLIIEENLSGKNIEVRTAIESYEKQAEIDRLLEKNKSDSFYIKIIISVFLVIIIFSLILIIITKRNQIRFKQLSNASFEAIFIYQDNTIVDVNNNFELLTGYSGKEVKSIKVSNLFSPDFELKITGNNTTPPQTFLIKKDGSRISVEVLSRSINLSKDNVLVVSIRDITKRKLDEEKLKQSEEKYKFITEKISDLIFQLDRDLNFIYLTPSCFHLLGYYPQELLGEPFTKLLPAVSVKYFQKYISYLKKNKSIICELKQVCKSGIVIWVEIQLDLIFDSENNLICYQGLSRNITDRKMMDIQLINAKDKAEQANKVKSEFVANISHEIRTPLNSILAYSDLLKRSMTDQESLKYIESIEKGGNNLLTIVNDLLDLSKIEAGRLDITYSVFKLSEIVNEVVNFFNYKINEKKLNLSIKYNNNFANSVLLDEIRLRQVLVNLVGNAIKFTNKGYVKIIIDQFLKENKLLDLFIVIEDSGIGIAENEFENIFKAFRQQEGQNTRKYGGTGLGLTITKRLVEMMNGTITVESQQGVGSRFIIYFKDVRYDELQMNDSTINYSDITTHTDILKIELSIPADKKNDIKENILPKLLEAKTGMIIDEIQNCAHIIKNYGTENNIDCLVNYGNFLYTESDSYNYDRINAAITNFTDLF